MAVNFRPCHADLSSRGIEEVKGWMVPSFIFCWHQEWACCIVIGHCGPPGKPLKPCKGLEPKYK